MGSFLGTPCIIAVEGLCRHYSLTENEEQSVKTLGMFGLLPQTALDFIFLKVESLQGAGFIKMMHYYLFTILSYLICKCIVFVFALLALRTCMSDIYRTYELVRLGVSHTLDMIKQWNDIKLKLSQ